MGGESGLGQCGTHKEMIMTPRMIMELNDYIVDKICCSSEHSYFRTRCGKHFMCGENQDNQCIIEDGKLYLYTPTRIDLIMKEKYNVIEILDAVLGYYNTTFVCVINE